MSLTAARRVLRIEAEAIRRLIPRLDHLFEKAVETLDQCRGRVVVTGMGKSGIIGRKIAATLASTGTPALFLHAGRGSTAIWAWWPGGRPARRLEQRGDGGNHPPPPARPPAPHPGDLFHGRSSFHAGPPERGEPRRERREGSLPDEPGSDGQHDGGPGPGGRAGGRSPRAPRLRARGLRPVSSGGRLGKLLLTVEDVMHRGREIPVVTADAPMKKAIAEMTAKKLGITTVVDGRGRLAGVVTDGDLRRALERGIPIADRKAGEIMSRHPKTIAKTDLAALAVALMEEHQITSLVIAGSARKVEGDHSPSRSDESGGREGSVRPDRPRAVSSRAGRADPPLGPRRGWCLNRRPDLARSGRGRDQDVPRPGRSRPGAGPAFGNRRGARERPAVPGRGSPGEGARHPGRPPGLPRESGRARESSAEVESRARRGCRDGGRSGRSAPCSGEAGLALAVSDAPAEVRKRADWVSRSPGGRGPCARPSR